MTHRVLGSLKTDEFAMGFSFISNPSAVHRALQRSKDVENLRLALRTGEITEETLRAFCASLLKDLEHGQRHHHEMAFAAIAVALETRPTPFAEEYVLDLARLELAELPIAIRVARKACQERLKLPGNKTKVFTLPHDDIGPPDDWQTVAKCRQVIVGHSEHRFELETT
jgi:hypothetical protein